MPLSLALQYNDGEGSNGCGAERQHRPRRGNTTWLRVGHTEENEEKPILVASNNRRENSIKHLGRDRSASQKQSEKLRLVPRKE